MKYRFQPRLLPALAMVCLVLLFIQLGLWQYGKAETRLHLQMQLEQRRALPPVSLPLVIHDPDAWRYRKVAVSGQYDPSHQILLDNQVNQGIAGYHVITPLKITGTDVSVLVNRGWIAAPADHRATPVVEVPTGRQSLQGDIWFPGKYFTLEEARVPGQAWESLWQNLDLEHYGAAVPFKILPYVVRLAPDAGDGQFVRNWPAPGARSDKNLAYAYQWFGFALTAFIIYLVTSIKRNERQ